MNIVPVLHRNVIWIAGFLILLLPSIWDLWHVLWSGRDQEHGPIILTLVCWIIWRELPRLMQLPDSNVSISWLFIFIALVLYALGRSQQIWLFELGAFIPLISGIVLFNKGWSGLKVLAFPLFFMFFVIPLPGIVVDTLTSGLKQHISEIAELVLYHLGYPVARNGVTLTIGQYQLLVADACSGINSLFSLFALGFIYLYLQNYSSKIRNILLLLAVIPVAVLANIIRVMVLVLVTYYFGDEAGQGFIHGLAGIMLFVVALCVMFIWDVLLGIVFKDKGEQR